MSDLDRPAHPVYTEAAPAHDFDWPNGLTKREHSAIELRVPLSGNAELDAMILAARRLDIATQMADSLPVFMAFRIADEILRKAGFAPTQEAKP